MQNEHQDGTEPTISSNLVRYKHILSIASIFQNEAMWLEEWIQFHILVGVTHFFLYNNESKDDYQRVLAPFIKRGYVTLCDWPNQPLDPDVEWSWAYKVQAPCLEHAIEVSKGSTEWLACLDTDEFLVPTANTSIIDILAKYPYASSINVDWLVFGTSDVEELPEGTLLLEALRHTAPSDSPINSIQKLILKPLEFTRFTWPPHKCECRLKPNEKDGPRIYEQLSKQELTLHHYIYRTRKWFRDIKMERTRLGYNSYISDEELQERNNSYSSHPYPWETSILPILCPRLRENLRISKLESVADSIRKCSS